MDVPLYKFFGVILIVFLNASELHAQNDITTPLSELFLSVTQQLKIGIQPLIITLTDSLIDERLLQARQKAAIEVPLSTPFPCNVNTVTTRSDQVPDSVHKLRPGDIDVIGAVGDSLSAGTGISAVTIAELFVLTQRGRAWSGGGEKTWRTYLTLPNILREFNPNLIGFAPKASELEQKESQLNVAVVGARSELMLTMAQNLVNRIKNDSRIDIKNHWKMVTLMIGDNDFCSEVCTYSNYFDSLENHRNDLLLALRYLRDNLPRTIVNVVPPPRLDVFYEMKDLPPQCYIIQNLVCPCVRSPKYKATRNVTSAVMVEWQQLDVEISNLPEFDLDDFTVVPQLYTLNYTYPKTPQGNIDYGYLGPDCFHLSERGQARFANDMWNSLLEPVGNKSTDGSPQYSKFHCPTEGSPYIFTRRNSQ